MNTVTRIRKALETSRGSGFATACRIYKGWDYDGQTENYGWHYRPFGQTPVFLGRNATEALETIEQDENYE